MLIFLFDFVISILSENFLTDEENNYGFELMLNG
jgi:hypothetical protein